MKHAELVNCTTDTKVGNHRVVIRTDGTKDLYYYSTVICKVNPSTKEYKTLERKISSSTSHAISRYRNFLNLRGYKEVTDLVI